MTPNAAAREGPPGAGPDTARRADDRERAGSDQARRLVPRTDVLLADPRLTAAEQRLGRDLVKQAVSRAQEAARAGRIPPDAVADTAVAALPARPPR